MFILAILFKSVCCSVANFKHLLLFVTLITKRPSLCRYFVTCTHTHTHTYIVREVHTLSNTLLVLHRSLSALVSSSSANGDVRTTKRTTRVRSGSRNQSASASRINSSHTGTYTMLAKHTHTHHATTAWTMKIPSESRTTHTLSWTVVQPTLVSRRRRRSKAPAASLSLLLAFE